MKLYVPFNCKGNPVGVFKSKTDAMKVHCSDYFKTPVVRTVQSEQEEYYCIVHETCRSGSGVTMVKVVASREKLKAALKKHGYLNNGKMIADIPYYSARCDENGYINCEKYVTDAILRRRTVTFNDWGSIDLFKVK